jgi:mannose-1-phosphate guanylyltransferase
MKKIAIILAGGAGGRLWPQSTESHPKQFRAFLSEQPMVWDTYNRLCQFYEKSDIYVISFKKYKSLLESVVSQLPKENILSEPFGRNTAPAIALAQTLLKEKYDKDDVITVFPSDHIVEDMEKYIAAIETSIAGAVEQDGIVSIGVEPSSPNNQLGYIQYADDGLADSALYKQGLRKAKVFAEKPDTGTAIRFLESGDFVWNTGVFSARFGILENEIKTYLPLLYSLIRRLDEKIGSEDFEASLEYTYKQITAISIDNGLLGKTKNLYVVKSSFGWNDLATWDEYFNMSDRDEHNNVLSGNVVALKTANSLIVSKEKLIAVSDVDDLVVIEGENSIFIGKRGQSEKVKDLINFIRAKELNKLI